MDDVILKLPLNINGALIVLQHWTPNLVFQSFEITHINLWVQLHGIPGEYFLEANVRRLARIASEVLVLDWYSPSAQAL
ncbi:hypothetical protein LIER_12967 [Lithospermum erythrorhizon]|uniref:DUF4283 domain-containing protein n=1 Tax=Lithospermum erythrorhizon TaxID=34254 RepID=A0AAV3PUG8_LITER